MRMTCVIMMLGIMAGAATAGPLDRSLVAAEAIWLAHLDLDGFKQTDMGRQVMAEMGRPEVEQRLTAFTTVFGFDPRTDVKSLTLYGTGTDPKEGVLLVRGQFDTNRLSTLVKGAKDYKASEHGGHVIHEWTDERKELMGRMDAHTVAAIHSGSVIFGQTTAAVSAALDVLDNVAANLGSTAYFQEQASSGKSFLQAATRQVEVPAGQPHSALLAQARYLSLKAGEESGQLKFEVVARTASEEAAQNMRKMGEGLVALMSLQSNKPAQAAVARATTVRQSGRQLTATIQLPSANVAQWMKHQWTKRQAASEEKEDK